MKIMKNKLLGVLLFFVMLTSFSGCGQTTYINKELSPPDGVSELNVSISDVYGDAGAIVTVISDDGDFETAQNLNDIFGKRNIKCTVAGVVDLVEPHLDQWHILLDNGAINLVSHSYDHIKMSEDSEISKDAEKLEHEISDADKWFESNFGNEQIAFVCPENTMCKNGYKILEKNDFWAVRRGSRGYNPLSPKEGQDAGNWFNLKVQGICDNNVDTSVRNEWIDIAVNDKVWLIEMWHNVKTTEDNSYQTILLPDAEEHLDYVADKSEKNEIWVATYDEAVKYIREKQNINVTAYINGNKLHVYAALTDPEMSYYTFNQPLTLHIELPSGTSAYQKEFCSDDGDLVLDVIPGAERVIEIKQTLK